MLVGISLNRSGVEKTDDISIMTCNIGDIEGGNPLGSEQVAEFIHDCGMSDVLLLQEVRGEKEAAYLSNLLNRPWFVFLPDFDSPNMGIAILSRWPVLNHDSLYFNDSQRGAGAIAAEIHIKGVPLLVVNLHLDRYRGVVLGNDRVSVFRDQVIQFVKKEMMEESIRSKSIRELLNWLDKKNSAHVVLGGDFNSIPFSRTIRLISPWFDDLLWPSLDYFKGTYTKLDFPIFPRIDFLFVSTNIVRKSARIIQKSPGDHYPIWAVIQVPAGG